MTSSSLRRLMPPLSPLAHAARGDPNWIKLLNLVSMERKVQISCIFSDFMGVILCFNLLLFLLSLLLFREEKGASYV